MTAKITTAVVLLGFMAAGVYLCVHDYPNLGGWTVILCLLIGYDKLA